MSYIHPVGPCVSAGQVERPTGAVGEIPRVGRTDTERAAGRLGAAERSDALPGGQCRREAGGNGDGDAELE